MTTGRMIEYRITRQLLQQREEVDKPPGSHPWLERMIAILAVTAGLSIVGSYSEEVLWAGLAIATLVTLR